MAGAPLPNLFSPITLGPVELKNRVVSTGHHTYLAHITPNDDLIAYHEARAAGGAGLIITEIVAVHETAAFSGQLLMALDDQCIGPFAQLSQAIHSHGAKVFAQLFHPGREIMSSTDGLTPVAYAPSAVPNERFHVMPQEMSVELIQEIVAGFGRAAGYLSEAGYDGLEIVASHGYLPSQFLNPTTNLRNDAYGGDFERRLAFLHQTIAAVRGEAPDLALGLRISGDELDDTGLDQETVLAVCHALAPELDYLSVVAGTSASVGGSVHIVPPMGVASGYTAPYARRIKEKTGIPVIATGRINQAQVAETILAAGDADLCGMTRAMIADSAMPRKAAKGQFDEIRACIACNQSCIGRANKGIGISCIQHPPSGRERLYGQLRPVSTAKSIIVVGGGPAGMKAATTAAARGHRVRLYEEDVRLGGQVLLAQRLPGREEFGGMATNLEAELARNGVEVQTQQSITAEQLLSEGPDEVILATGARPYLPAFDGRDEGHVVTAWELLSDRANVGSAVVIADWKADWIGLGLAEQLARAGCSVTLCTNAALAGETLQPYVRNHYVGRLHRLGVSIRTHSRLFGIDGATAYFQDTLTQEPILLEGIDTLVLSLGHVARNDLGRSLRNAPFPVRQVGDCRAPRTAEEAIFEGFKAGYEI